MGFAANYQKFPWFPGWIGLSLILCSMTAVTNAQDRELFSQAIRNGKTESIRSLIKKNPKLLKLPDKNRVSPLFAAVHHGQLDSVKTLVDLGASTRNSRSQPILHFALARHHPEVTKYLIEVTKDINELDQSNLTPLACAVMNRQTTAEIVELLLRKGAELEANGYNQQTPLHLACYFRRDDLAKILVDAGADLTATDNNGNTPLLISALTSPDLLRVMLKRRPDMTVVNRRGQSVLHLACQSRNIDSVKQIIDSFPNIDITDKSGLTPLMSAIYANSAEVVEFLLDRGANPDGTSSEVNPKVERPILAACRAGDERVVKRLLEAGCDIKLVNAAGENCLHLATQAQGVYFGQLVQQKKHRQKFAGLIQCLLDRGADRYLTNRDGKTPLAIAAEQNFFEAIELLIDDKQDLSSLAPEGFPLHWAAENGLLNTLKVYCDHQGMSLESLDDKGQTPLMVASRNGTTEIINFLVQRKVDILTKDDRHMSALLIAASAGQAQAVRRLVDASANLMDTDASGQSALHMAAWNGSVEATEILLQKLGPRKIKSPNGYTPLHGAAWNGHSAVVQKLLLAGFDPNTTDSDGWTPLHKAAFRGHYDSVMYLLQNGALTELTTEVGATALEMATSKGHQKTIELLERQ